MKKLCQAISVLSLLFVAQPIMAEKVRKMEVIVTDTERLTEGKIRLNLAEIAEQLAPYQSPVDLSAYVKLAGDEDGQTIQGLTGNNKARIELSLEGEVDKAALIGGGATYGFIYAYADGVYGESPDESTSFDLYNGGLDLTTNGAAQFYGSISTNLGSTAGWTAVSGSRVNVTSLQTPPTNANDPCTAGDTIDTATYHYYCAATDTWVRVAMATW